MAYDPDFYAKYRSYLGEDIVRKNHNIIFRNFLGLTWPSALCVADLGCGLREYAAHGPWSSYVGVDQNDAGWLEKKGGARFVCGNYRDPSLVDQLPFSPNAFVSLFSTECFMTA